MRARVILITGPTTSGKSALAVALARRFNGAVVNADSMQVYRDFGILSARPTEQEMRAVPHHLFGHVDAAENYSVGRWLADAQAILAQLRAEGRTPVLAGGTGMYFKAALYGLSDIPAVPEEVRARVRREAEGRAPQELHAQLAALDPGGAQLLRPSDPQRILRALEIFAATGQPLSSFQKKRSAPLLQEEECAAFFVAPERALLFERIDARFDAMMRAGALEEVAALRARGLDPALPAMRAHGAPPLMAHLDGRLGLEEAVARAKLDTRHYAKRQVTFARHQLPGFAWLTGVDVEAQALAALDAAR
jgi:tRNA dimethylallyltransferase